MAQQSSLEIEYYRGVAIMYHPIKEKYYFYEGEYTRSRPRYFKTFEEAIEAIDRYPAPEPMTEWPDEYNGRMPSDWEEKSA